MISLIGLSFADFSILHSFFTLVNIFFHLFLKPLSSSLECSLNLPCSSSFVKPFFTFFYLFLFFSKIKKRTGSLLLSHRSTIVAVMMLNFCVRDGYRCFHHAIATRSLLVPSSRSTQNWTVISPSSWTTFFWLSPRPISISQLRTSLPS